MPEEYHAYALDLRGHGQSQQPGSYQLPEFVEDIYALTQELGIEKFTFFPSKSSLLIAYLPEPSCFFPILSIYQFFNFFLLPLK